MYYCCFGGKMKKKRKELRETFSFLLLYYDDLEEIINILKELTDDIRIETDNYILDSIEDILSIKESSIKEIKIHVDGTNIFLSVSNNDASLTANDSVKERGAFEQIKTILNKNTRLKFFSHKKILGIFTKIIAGISGGIFGILISLGKTGESLLMVIVAIFFIWLEYFLSTKSFLTIIPQYKSDVPSFFKRKKDDILLIAISSLVTAIITFLMTMYFNK